MNAGLSVIANGGKTIFQKTGREESGGTSLLSHYHDAHFTVGVMGRIYYRQERIDELNCGEKKRICNSDANYATLVVAMYKQFGQQGVDRLEGDFAILLHDKAQQKLIGWRDPMGGYPLFWAQKGEVIIFSTHFFPLLNFLGHTSLSPEFIAEYLTAPSPINELNSEVCAFKGVHRVMAGCRVVASLEDNTVIRDRYWAWGDRVPHVDPQTVAQDYEQLLRDSVRERLHGVNCAHLSGGMDSTAVALLAKEALHMPDSLSALHTVSLVYRDLEELAYETPYLQTVLDLHKDFISHRVQADELLDFDGFVQPPVHDEPYSSLWRLALDQATILSGVAAGADTLLTGIGADELLDIQPFHITDLLRRFCILAAWREATRWARSDNSNPWEVLHLFGLSNLTTLNRMVNGFSQILGKEETNSIKESIPPWITRDFATSFNLAERAQEKKKKVTNIVHGSTTISVAVHAIESRIGDFNRWYVAAPHGLHIAHPFLDLRILQKGLGIVAKLKPEPGAMKPVLTRAMVNVLPEKIRTRRKKGHFNEVYYRGLAKNRHHLESLIEDSSFFDHGIFERSTLLECLEQAALGGMGVRDCQHLNFTLSLLRWHSQLEDTTMNTRSLQSATDY